MPIHTVAHASALVLANANRHARAIAWAAVHGDSRRRSKGTGAIAAPSPPHGPRARWQPYQIKALTAYLRTLQLGQRISTKTAAQAIGWPAELLEDKAQLKKLQDKLAALRRNLRHGRDPLAGPASQQVRKGTYDWPAWLRNAFSKLPDQEGTADEVAAVVEADPEVAPKLDRRPDPQASGSTPYWKSFLRKELSRSSEVIKTDLPKRNRQAVYRYQTAQQQELGGWLGGLTRG